MELKQFNTILSKKYVNDIATGHVPVEHSEVLIDIYRSTLSRTPL